MENFECPNLVLLSGTPGTGKSTLSQLISENNSWTVFNLGEFIIKKGHFHIEEGDTETKTINLEKATDESAIELIKILNNQFRNPPINENRPIIIDSHYADIILDGLDNISRNIKVFFKKLNIDLDYDKIKSCIASYSNGKHTLAIVLRCKPSELEKRLKSRNYSKKKLQENIQAEILGESTSNMLAVLKKETIFEIDTSLYDTSQCCDIIVNLVQNSSKEKELFKMGTINWLQDLAESGMLVDYFKDKLGLTRTLKDVQDNDKVDE